jgi:cytochrome c oxidase subunit I+III
VTTTEDVRSQAWPDVEVEEHEPTLEEAWEDPPGLIGFFTTVDHKRIGVRYIVTAFLLFALAGLMALGMRAQLARPDQHLVGPQSYDELFTMHGTIMIFLFNTPVLAGFGNYLLPLMLGTRDMAFPRLNAFSYWVFLGASTFMLSSAFVGRMPATGWFAYVPLTGAQFSHDRAVDYWGLGVVFIGVSTTVGAINFLVTAQKLRAPGMALHRIPLFVWSILAMALMVVFAVPAVTLAAGLLELDRLVGTAIFVPHLGGQVLLYQHLFWFWGHPEVYILFLPAVGMVSSIIPVAARERHAGYLWVVTSFLAIAFISFGVWVHHMFATGLPAEAAGFFSAASLVIALPSGVLYFCWIATMYLGRIRWTVPMLFCAGFLGIFLAGGITGVMVAVLPFDVQVTDSYFIVAHFHYVLNGAVVFPIFGAVYHWFPKMIGRRLSERLGKWSFWIMVVSFQFTFFPMHILGLLGMPRRIYTYADGLGWNALNMMISIGGAVFGLGVLLTFINIAWNWRRGEPAPADPWGGDTLEWSVASPTPEWNFASIPVVDDMSPLWVEGGPAVATGGDDEATRSLGVEGARARTTPITRGLAARPAGTMPIPAPTWLPFGVAAGIFVVAFGALYRAVPVLVAGAAVGIVALVWWLWRTEEDLR